MVKCSTSMYKALGSIPTLGKKKEERGIKNANEKDINKKYGRKNTH